jgi:hypothetical protein
MYEVLIKSNFFLFLSFQIKLIQSLTVPSTFISETFSAVNTVYSGRIWLLSPSRFDPKSGQGKQKTNCSVQYLHNRETGRLSKLSREYVPYVFIQGTNLSTLNYEKRMKIIAVNLNPVLITIKKFTIRKQFKFLIKKCYFFVILRGLSSHKRSFQLTKENIQHFKTRNFFTFSFWRFIFMYPGTKFV